MLFLACSQGDRNTVIDPNFLDAFYHDESSFISAHGVTKVNVSNHYGSIIVTGWSLDDSIRAYLAKTIKTESRQIAELHFNDIKSEVVKDGDTLNISISAPVNSDNIYYFSSLSLEIPLTMDCAILHSDRMVKIDGLNSDLHIHEAEEVEVSGLNGACEVASRGNIAVQMTLPADGFCHLTSDNGHITLRLPTNTSGRVTARTAFGIVEYFYLDFSELEHENNSLSGKLGTGSAEIIMATNVGNITIIGSLLSK